MTFNSFEAVIERARRIAAGEQVEPLPPPTPPEPKPRIWRSAMFVSDPVILDNDTQHVNRFAVEVWGEIDGFAMVSMHGTGSDPFCVKLRNLHYMD
jgi:hypothetical protein